MFRSCVAPKPVKKQQQPPATARPPNKNKNKPQATEQKKTLVEEIWDDLKRN